MKNTVTLDFTNCKYITELHKIIKNAFGFPDWYGCNWDAFWDMGYDYINENTHIVIKGIRSLPKDFGNDINCFFEVLDDIQSASQTITYEVVS